MNPTSLEQKGDPFEENYRGKCKLVGENRNPGSGNRQNGSDDWVRESGRKPWVGDSREGDCDSNFWIGHFLESLWNDIRVPLFGCVKT